MSQELRDPASELPGIPFGVLRKLENEIRLGRTGTHDLLLFCLRTGLVYALPLLVEVVV